MQQTLNLKNAGSNPPRPTIKAKIVKYGALCSICHCDASCIDIGEEVTIIEYDKNKTRMRIQREECIAWADAITLQIKSS